MQAVLDGALRRARLAVSAAFLCQGLLFAVLLTHLPSFKDAQRIGDTVVTLVVLGVTLLAGVGSAAGLRLGFVVPLVLTLGVAALAPAFAPAPARTAT